MNAVGRVLSWIEAGEHLLARWLRAAREALLGEMSALAGGTALFAILAIVPTLAAAVAVFGLISNPELIQSQVRGLETVLPSEVVSFIGDELARQAKRSSGELGLAIATSVVVAMYSARGAAAALINALNRAYRVRDRRGPLHRLGISIAMAGATLVGLMVIFGGVVALPGILALLHVENTSTPGWVRWPILMAVVFASLMLLYRFAPSPRPLGTERHLWPGSFIGTLLLVAVSWGLSQWVERVADYALFYGAFGSVIVILLWFYLSTIALVIGGFVNAELERHAGAPPPDRSMY